MFAGWGSRAARSAGPVGLAFLAAVAVAACADGGDGATAGPVRVGVGASDERDPAIAVLEYLPGSVTVPVGSTVEWTAPGPERHSITFLPAGQPRPAPGDDPSRLAPSTPPGRYDGTTLAHSGLVPGEAGAGPGATFRVTFGRAGTYPYVCVVHPRMTGTVEVVERGGRPDTQDRIDARAAAELARWLEEGRAAKRDLDRNSPKSERAPDGSTTWRIEMGATTEHTDVVAFAPSAAEVRPGDRVVFVNDSATPHTATFPAGTPLPVVVDAREAAPVPGPSPQTLAAGGYLSTGVLPPNVAGGPGPPGPDRSFTFLAPTPGTYSYVCLLRRDRGMAGSVKVA